MEKKTRVYAIKMIDIKGNKAGFTLIELIIVLAIVGVVASAIYSMNLFGAQTFASGQDQAQKQFDVRMAADFIIKQLQYATSVAPKPATQSPGTSQIYLDTNKHIIYNKKGTITNVPGIDKSSFYKLSFSKISDNVIQLIVGTLDDKYSVTSQVTILNIAATIPSFSNVSGLEYFINSAAPPTISAQPTDKIVNIGGAAQLSITASGTGPLSYQWYSNTTNSNSGGSIISGAASSSYNAPTSTTGTTYYYCIVTNTDRTAADTKIAEVTSSFAKVVVNSPIDTAPPTIISDPPDIAVNLNEDATLSITASGTGSLTYQWYRNSTNSISSGILISGATSFSYSAPTSTTGKNYYYCIVTNTDLTVTGNKTAAVTSRVATVEVASLTYSISISARTTNNNDIISVGEDSYKIMKKCKFLIDIKCAHSDSSLTIAFAVTGDAVTSITDKKGDVTFTQFTANKDVGKTGTVKAYLMDGGTVLATSNVLTFVTIDNKSK